MFSRRGKGAKFEDVAWFREEYTWIDHQHVEIASYLAQLRTSFSTLADEDWRHAVSVKDKAGQDVDFKAVLRETQFPLTVTLPNKVQMFASLNRQQALVAQQQATLSKTLPKMFGECREQFIRAVSQEREDMREFIVFEMKQLMSSIALEFEAERKGREANQTKTLEQILLVGHTCNTHLDQATATAPVISEIASLCEKSQRVLQEVTGSLKQSQQLRAEQFSGVIQKLKINSDTLHTNSVKLEMVPNIMKELHESVGSLHTLANSLKVLPSVCSDTNNKCDNVKDIAIQLTAMPSLLQATHTSCEDIQRMVAETKSSLSSLEDHRRTFLHMQDSLSHLQSVTDTHHEEAKIAHDAIERLSDSLAPVPDALLTTQSKCELMQDCVADLLPTEMKALQQQNVDNLREGQMQHQTVIDRIASVELLVSKSQPLTLDQYMLLQKVMQQILTEMRNPIPQPKMAIANATVHVHKAKKCDDVAVSKGLTAGKPTSFSLRDHFADLEVELPSISGRLKIGGMHDDPLRPHTSSNRRAESARGESREKKSRALCTA